LQLFQFQLLSLKHTLFIMDQAAGAIFNAAAHREQVSDSSEVQEAFGHCERLIATIARLEANTEAPAEQQYLDGVILREKKHLLIFREDTFQYKVTQAINVGLAANNMELEEMPSSGIGIGLQTTEDHKGCEARRDYQLEMAKEYQRQIDEINGRPDHELTTAIYGDIDAEFIGVWRRQVLLANRNDLRQDARYLAQEWHEEAKTQFEILYDDGL
jgi:hypothetical protein